MSLAIENPSSFYSPSVLNAPKKPKTIRDANSIKPIPLKIEESDNISDILDEIGKEMGEDEQYFTLNMTGEDDHKFIELLVSPKEDKYDYILFCDGTWSKSIRDPKNPMCVVNNDLGNNE